MKSEKTNLFISGSKIISTNKPEDVKSKSEDVKSKSEDVKSKSEDVKSKTEDIKTIKVGKIKVKAQYLSFFWI